MTPVIAIVGGGTTGATLAIHLAKRIEKNRVMKIVVFEPREHLGAGLAYSTSEPTHRINVPAGKMTAYPDDPDSFLRFTTERGVLATDPEAIAPNGLPYPRRSVFGDYLWAEIEPYIRSGVIEHRQTTVTRIEKLHSGWKIDGENGSVLSANAVAIAVTHPAPAVPHNFGDVKNHAKFVADTTQDNALDAIENNDRVLIVGNGLTSADVIATLTARGHQGPIISISRRGLRSRGHAKIAQDPYGDFLSNPSLRASQLLRRVRATIRDAEQEGVAWQAVIDAVRAQGQDIWQILPVRERKRLARHVRSFWDVHRFRTAPQVENALDTAIAAGQLCLRAASVRQAGLSEKGFSVTLRERGKEDLVSMQVDAIIVTTGPDHGDILGSQPFLTHLREEGLLRMCETRLGIACDRTASAIDQHGLPVDGLFIAGPLARGTFGELMGVPQVIEHAIFVADRLDEYLG